jgi:predicted Abi (CAAX) family protease
MVFEYFLMLPVIQTLVHRVGTAVSTLPSVEAWLFSALLLLILTLISLPIGFSLGFLQVEVLKTSRGTVAGIIIACLFSPAITEEVFFRVLFLPRLDENAATASLWLWGCMSLAIFIVYHPLNALSFYPAGMKTFFDPVFLLLAGFLGIVCSIAYLQSGSLWLPVAIHWLVVVVWLLLLGGYGKLNT